MFDSQENFVIDRNKDDVIWVITTYISHEIQFHTSGNSCPWEVWKKLKSSFDKVNESRVMQIGKELISLDPPSFQRIEEYLARIKELHLKLGGCEKGFPKKDGQLI